MSDEVADTLKAERVSLREGARDEHVRVLERECHRVLAGEVHVSLIEHHDTARLGAKRVQLGGAVAATARRVGSGDERERGLEVPALLGQGAERGQSEVGVQRNGVALHPCDVGENGVERVAGVEILDCGFHQVHGATASIRELGDEEAVLRLDECPRRQREQFIRAVADDDVLRRASMKFCESLAQRGGRRVRVKSEPSVHCRLQRRENFGRGWVGILVGVELYEPANLRLLAGDIGVQPLNKRTNQRALGADCHARSVGNNAVGSRAALWSAVNSSTARPHRCECHCPTSVHQTDEQEKAAWRRRGATILYAARGCFVAKLSVLCHSFIQSNTM